MDKKPELYEKLEGTIAAWEAESKTVAEDAVIRLSETILPNETRVNLYQLVDEGLFAILIAEEEDYNIVHLCSDYLDSYSKLLHTLGEIMFGEDEEPAPVQQPQQQPQMRFDKHGRPVVESNVPPMEEEDVEEVEEPDEGEKTK